MKLTIIRGLPGSGKSTLALKMLADAQRNLEECVRLEADLFHTMSNGQYVYKQELARYAHEFCRGNTAFYLNKGSDVIVANTFTTIGEALPYFKIAKACGADFEIIVCTGNYENVHDVPEDVMDKMSERWENFTVEDLEQALEAESSTEQLESLRAALVEGENSKKGFFKRIFS